MSADLIKALEDTLARPTCEFLRIDRKAATELLAILKPPAREDAQPVARLTDLADDAEAMSLEIAVRNYSVTGASLASDLRAVLCTHPAPDALRGAVEALEKTRDRIQQWPIDDHETCMCGSTIEAHDVGSGHSPVSQADHAISIIVEEINKALSALQAEQDSKS